MAGHEDHAGHEDLTNNRVRYFQRTRFALSVDLRETLSQTHRPLGEVGDIVLIVDRIPLGVDAIHVEESALGLFEGDQV